MTTGEGEKKGERTRDGVPLLWATAQSHLSNALQALGAR
jgi:hypothetical protein